MWPRPWGLHHRQRVQISLLIVTVPRNGWQPTEIFSCELLLQNHESILTLKLMQSKLQLCFSRKSSSCAAGCVSSS